MSFFMIAFGSYGFPRKVEPLPATSVTTLAILFQMIGADGVEPNHWHCT